MKSVHNIAVIIIIDYTSPSSLYESHLLANTSHTEQTWLNCDNGAVGYEPCCWFLSETREKPTSKGWSSDDFLLAFGLVMSWVPQPMMCGSLITRREQSHIRGCFHCFLRCWSEGQPSWPELSARLQPTFTRMSQAIHFTEWRERSFLSSPRHNMSITITQYYSGLWKADCQKSRRSPEVL